MSKILTLAALVIALALFGAPLAQAQDSPNDFSNESQFAPQSSIPSDPKAALTVCPGTEVDLVSAQLVMRLFSRSPLRLMERLKCGLLIGLHLDLIFGGRRCIKLNLTVQARVSQGMGRSE